MVHWLSGIMPLLVSLPRRSAKLCVFGIDDHYHMNVYLLTSLYYDIHISITILSYIAPYAKVDMNPVVVR